jgi:uncharacterized repeat protein (TIGR03806 family)
LESKSASSYISGLKPSVLPVFMKKILGILFVAFLAYSCKDDDEVIVPEERSPVVFDLDSVPYTNLSDYGFFKGNLVDHSPVKGVIPYEVITPLFSDYAHKYRFIWMPEGVSATYNGDHNILSFQDGTVLLKTFYYDRVQPTGQKRVIETRMEFMRNGQWEFAEYIWNDDQTEAVLDLSGEFVPLTWLDEDDNEVFVNWRIPSETECLTCHKRNENAIPIGPKPQNINMLYNYAEGVKNQLEKWEEEGYLESGYPTNIITVPAWDDPLVGMEERVRAYIDMNCAHCHSEGTHCDYRPMRLAFSETSDLVNLGVCVVPDQDVGTGATHIISAGNPNRSLMLHRMNTTNQGIAMPLLGRSIIHEEAIELLTEYINSLEEPCE